MSLKPNDKSIKYSIGEYQCVKKYFVEKHTVIMCCSLFDGNVIVMLNSFCLKNERKF